MWGAKPGLSLWQAIDFGNRTGLVPKGGGRRESPSDIGEGPLENLEISTQFYTNSISQGTDRESHRVLGLNPTINS